jgi:hypothetical protein
MRRRAAWSRTSEAQVCHGGFSVLVKFRSACARDGSWIAHHVWSIDELVGLLEA